MSGWQVSEMREFLLKNQRLLSALSTDLSAGLSQAMACSVRLVGAPAFFQALVQAGLALALREVGWAVCARVWCLGNICRGGRH